MTSSLENCLSRFTMIYDMPTEELDFENTIFSPEPYLNPKYNHLEKYVNIMYKGFWTPAKYEKLIREQDAPHYFNEMNSVEKECIKRCILAVATVEDKVKSFWNTLSNDIPQTVVGDVGGVYGQSEVTHRRSYHALLDALKIDLSEINEHVELEGRLKYLTKHVSRNPKISGKKHILKKLVLFTALVERASLFTQFYILMSFARSNKGLKTISSLQKTTAIEEKLHYRFGIDLIDIIKEEVPELWDDYLVELVGKNIKMAHKTELELIDWFFEKGVPSHITKDEVRNFLNYNFSVISNDLGLDLDFNYDKSVYESQNLWFTEKTIAPTEIDFFDNASGGYSSEEIDEDLDELEL